jgi:hypothetical protein
MGAEFLESIPVFSMRPQAIQVEVPALQKGADDPGVLSVGRMATKAALRIKRF